jgi:hypothetical protein
MESNLAQQLDTVEDLNIAIDCFIPKTVEEAVDRLISELPSQDKNLIADMYEDEVPFLSATILGVYIQNEFGLGLGNEALMDSCCSTVGVNELNFFGASTVIIEKLSKKLRETRALLNVN